MGKVPLARRLAGHRYRASTHIIENIRPAELTGALLHFKIFRVFPARAALEVGGMSTSRTPCSTWPTTMHSSWTPC